MKGKCLAIAVVVACMNTGGVTFASELPVWAGQALDELAMQGAIEAAPGGSFLAADISRQESAAILARSLHKLEQEGVPERSASGSLNEFAQVTRSLAKMQREQDMDTKELPKVQRQYEAALEKVDKLAASLARLTAGDGSAGDIRNCEAEYAQAIADFGFIVGRRNSLEAQISSRRTLLPTLENRRMQLLSSMAGISTSERPVMQDTLVRLKAELAPELEQAGYLPPEQLAPGRAATVQRASVQKPLNINGEIRYHNAANDGPGRLGDDDSRLRARLYIDADISQLSDYLNDSWRAYTMLEYEYSLTDKRITNELFDRPRFYVEGMAGLVKLTLGRYGYMLAEGNIYDTSFTGVKAEVQDENVTYRLGYGHADDISKGYVAEADVNNFDYTYGAGLYRLIDNADITNTIMMAKGAYLFDDFTLGAMYLRSSRASEHQNGFIYTLGYGTLQSWQPGTYNLFARYYDQGRNTYVAHTMTGLGGRMNGFKGYQLGGYYTLDENLVAGLEYYDLKDKVTDETGRTLWSQVTYYF